ncbi:MAG: hypothetical protein ABJA78_16925 [Ferruginibacter sp.]
MNSTTVSIGSVAGNVTVTISYTNDGKTIRFITKTELLSIKKCKTINSFC